MKMAINPIQQQLAIVQPYYKLVAQVFDQDTGQVIFQVRKKQSPDTFEVAARTLFNNNKWLARFTVDNIRQIAFAAIESVLAMEQKAIEKVSVNEE